MWAVVLAAVWIRKLFLPFFNNRTQILISQQPFRSSGTTNKAQRPSRPSATPPMSVSLAVSQPLAHSSRRIVPSMRRTAPVGTTLTRPVRKFIPPASLETMAGFNNHIFFPPSHRLQSVLFTVRRPGLWPVWPGFRSGHQHSQLERYRPTFRPSACEAICYLWPCSSTS